MVRGGKKSKKFATATAMVLTWPGVPVTACANMRPRASKTPADKSPLSRTMGLNAVRINAPAISSATACKRFQTSAESMAAAGIMRTATRASGVR